MSDSLVTIGPFGIGLDGILTWAPILGAVYSTGAGVALIGLGIRVRASPTSLALVAGAVFARTVIGEAPIAGQLAADLLRGHKWAADRLVSEIDRTDFLEPGEAALDPPPGARRRRVWLD